MEKLAMLSEGVQNFLDGYDKTPVRSRRFAKDRLLHFHRLIEGVRAGRVPQWIFMKEAQTSSDFPLMFADTLDRIMLGGYSETPYTWNMIARRATPRDFRDVKRFAMDGNRGRLTRVGGANATASYPERSKSETQYSYGLSVFGAKTGYSWQSFINDDLGALDDNPMDFGVSSRRTEEYEATRLFANNTTYYSAGNANRVVTANGAATNNPALSIAGLQSAMTVLANHVDSDTEPIAIDTVVLVVPPALEITARNILNATAIEITEAGGTSNQKLIAQNWMRNRVQLAVNYYLPIVDETYGATGWYLFAAPNSSRPAMEVGFLRGNEQPQMFMKSPNAVRIGGGQVSPMDGDFDSDDLMFKVRHCWGGTMMDPKMSVFSEGDGS